MTINGVQVITEAGSTAGLTVEFVDDLGTIVSVRFSGKDGGVNRTNAVQQAKSYLQHLVQSDAIPDEMNDGDNQDGRAATIASSPNSPTERAGSKRS